MSNGRSGNGRSTTPRVSNDGRSVAFVSGMTDVAGDRNGATADVFLRDLGATNAMRLTSAQAPADRPDISAEGKFVAFTTTAALVSSDTNGLSDVYGRMLSDGSLTHLSATENRRTGTTGESSAPSVSGWLNGAYVTAFASGASNLVPSDTNGTTRDIFVRMPVS
jgi:Tol biopolymer transport system component